MADHAGGLRNGWTYRRGWVRTARACGRTTFHAASSCDRSGYCLRPALHRQEPMTSDSGFCVNECKCDITAVTNVSRYTPEVMGQSRRELPESGGCNGDRDFTRRLHRPCARQSIGGGVRRRRRTSSSGPARAVHHRFRIGVRYCDPHLFAALGSTPTQTVSMSEIRMLRHSSQQASLLRRSSPKRPAQG